MKVRKVDRKPIRIEGQCCTLHGHVFSITIGDLTEGGCRFAEAGHNLAPGAPVNLMILGTGPYRAQVRWRERGEIGVAFARPLESALAAALAAGEPVPNREGAATQAPAAPGLAAPLGPMRRVC